VSKILNSVQFRDLINDLRELGKDLSSKQLERLLNEGYEPGHYSLWGETSQGPREIAVIGSVVFHLGVMQELLSRSANSLETISNKEF